MPPDMEQMPDQSPQEAMIVQREQHHSELSGQMDALIHQTEQNNPNHALEAIIGQNEDIKQSLDEMKQPTKETGDAVSKMASFLSEMKGEKGEKGDKGDTGERGEKGDTGPAGKDSIVAGPPGERGATGPQGVQGIQGIEGQPGRDGLDGIDGKDGRDGKNGKDGKNGIVPSGKELAESLNKLKGDDRISYDSLKDAPLFPSSSRDYDFIELTDVPHSYANAAGKTVKVNAAGTGLEFATGGSGGSSAVYVTAEQAGLLPAGLTVFLGKGQANDDEFPLFVARVASTVTELLVMSITGNGSGHTDLYKVFKNGVATSMTLSVTNSSGGGVVSTTSNQVSLSVGDRVAIQVVADASTVAANILVQLTVTPN